MSDLFDVVYQELRLQADRHRHRRDHYFTLDTTAIVHEAYERLVDQSISDFAGRSRFLCIASRAMRHVLIDCARMRKAEKRGDEPLRVSMDEPRISEAGEVNFDDDLSEDLIGLHSALQQLESENERWARIVDCRFFGGMSIAETAEAAGVSTATVKCDWALAKVWLFDRMTAWRRSDIS